MEDCFDLIVCLLVLPLSEAEKTGKEYRRKEEGKKKKKQQEESTEKLNRMLDKSVSLEITKEIRYFK